MPKGFSEAEIKVYEFVANNPSATIARIAQELGVAERTVKNHLAKLKKHGKISRVGGKTPQVGLTCGACARVDAHSLPWVTSSCPNI